MIFSDPRIAIFAALGMLVILSWIMLSLRLWVRMAVQRRFGWDDALLISSALVYTAYCTVCVLIEDPGQISHADSLSSARLSSLINLLIARTELYIGTMVILKTAIGLIYLRIVNAAWQRYAVLTTVVFNTAYGVVMFHLTLFNCGNPTHYLEHALQNVCMSPDSLYAMAMSAVAANALTDWILAVLPMFMLIKIAMPIWARLATAGVLILGSCASFVSLIKILYLRDLVNPATFFSSMHELAFWSILEGGLGLVAASPSALRPLFPSAERAELESHSRTEGAHKRNITIDSLSDGARSDQTSVRNQTPQLAPHDFYDAESQNKSHFSLISVSPAIRKPRLLDRLGLSYMNFRINQDDDDFSDGDSSDVVRRSTLERSPVNGRLEMSRKISVREQGISRPHLNTNS